jgi:hypothetical protein
VDPETGRRCASRIDLQYHHIQPWAEGGRHELSNVTLRCAPHNLHAARRDFGQPFIDRRIAEARGQAVKDRNHGYLPRGRENPDGSSRACEEFLMNQEPFRGEDQGGIVVAGWLQAVRARPAVRSKNSRCPPRRPAPTRILDFLVCMGGFPPFMN